jgi:PAS domain S-box-containing protein
MSANTIEVQRFLDLAGVFIVVIGSDQKVIYINKQGCEILGHEREDILGKNWFDSFLPEKIRDDIKTVYSKLMAGEVELAEYFDNVILTKGGQERIIGWHNTVLKNEAGTIVGTLSWGVDITDRRRTDKKREDLIQELQNRVSELKSMKMKIPICSWNKGDMQEAIKKHYHQISIDGKCSECLHVLKMLPKAKD